MENQEKQNKQKQQDIVRLFMISLSLCLLLAFASIIYDIIKTPGNIKYILFEGNNILRTSSIILSMLGLILLMLLRNYQKAIYYVLYGIWFLFISLSIIYLFIPYDEWSIVLFILTLLTCLFIVYLYRKP